MKKLTIASFFRLICLRLFSLVFFAPLSLLSVPDLTIVGNVLPEDGLGKIPINILETLGEEVSSNLIISHSHPLQQEVSPCVIKALENKDNSPGKISLLTAALWYKNGSDITKLPNESIIKLAYSMLETTHIPNRWVKILNEEFDAVVVPDKFLVKVYEAAGVQIPIFVLPIPMMLNHYYAHPIHPKLPSNPFVFGDASANKNPGVLAKAFALAFGNDPAVRLVMRAGNIRPETREIVTQIISHYELTNVILEDGHVFLQEYINRLASFDCYVNLSRGEGFSFIPREALALGVPVIITNNTASTTICDSGCVREVPSLKRVPPLPIYKDLFGDENCGEQFDCEIMDVVAALRDVYENYESHIKKAHKGRKWVNQYDTSNQKLRKTYKTLIKPKKIVLGVENKITDDRIITSSRSLYNKYKQIIISNK